MMTSSVSLRLNRSERNSWPRTGTSPSHGTFEMFCSDPVLQQTAEDEALAAAEFDRRFGAPDGQRGNLQTSF